MSMRRHRVKATANLTNVKRKPRNPLGADNSSADTKVAIAAPVDQFHESGKKVRSPPTDTALETPKQLADQTKEENDEQLDSIVASLSGEELQQYSDVKPARTTVAESSENVVNAFKRPTTAINQDDMFHSDIDDNVIQMDLQKSTNGFPMSPSAKTTPTRQRVRPTPLFGQRRNSFVCASPSPHTGGSFDVGSDVFTSGGVAIGSFVSSGNDFMSPGTPLRRERYYSGSSNAPGTPQPAPLAQHKYFSAVNSPGMGRIRTESTCSAYSDYSVSGSKGRKGNEDPHKQNYHQRINARRDFETRFNNGVPDKSTFKMFDMIYYNPQTNPMEQKPSITTIKAEGASNGGVDKKPPKEELIENVEPSAMLVPQLKLNANGEMIIDEKTLEIETTAEQEARKMLANSSLILMDENTGMNGFYKRQKRTRGWTAEETVRFYRALQIVGTDFSLMCQLFKERTRRDLKLKYKREERVNGALINKALLYPKVFNIEELQQQLDREDREREEFHKHWQAMKQVEAEIYPKESKTVSKSARALEGGNFVHENEHVTKQKLGKRTLKRVNRSKTKSGENNTTESHTDEAITALKDKPKRRRKQNHTKNVYTELPATHLSNNEVPCIIESTVLPPFAMIKQEAKIKMEKTNYNMEDEAGQCVLEKELNELLEQPEIQESSVLSGTTESTSRKQPSGSPKCDSILPGIGDTTFREWRLQKVQSSEMTCEAELITPREEFCVEEQVSVEHPAMTNKTIINMDDGTYTIETAPAEQTIESLMQQQISELVYADEPAAALSPKTKQLEMQMDADTGHVSPLSEKDTVEVIEIEDLESERAPETGTQDEEVSDIQQILTLLAEGALVLVSTLDTENADNVIHEIYEMNPTTGKLCEEPLDIPENIVQCILAVMS